MCGIAGIVETRPDGVDADCVERMSRRLAHRGPDDLGYLGWWPDGRIVRGRLPETIAGARVALAHRRLSIIDVGDGGWQPMPSDDGGCDIVFNGEIYNYRELRAELRAAGRRFRSQSDTEVLLASYAQWSERALSRLIGMFAFAVLDRPRQRLFLARDFAGMKPLFTSVWSGGFAFASEIKALLELPMVSRRVDATAVRAYLEDGLVDHAEHTFFADVARVPAAHWIEVSLARARASSPRRYWSLPVRSSAGRRDDSSARLSELLGESVRLHMRSDVPVGAALSGGIDSSAIVAWMREVAGDGGELHTFTYVADDAEAGEERWADMVAIRFDARAHKTRVDGNDLRRNLDDLIDAQDEPFGSTSIFAQWSVFALTHAAGIKVVLDGQGADEMFAGYRPFLAARTAELARAGHLCSALALAHASAQLPGERRLRTLLRILAGLLPEVATKVLAQRRRRRSLWGRSLRRAWFERHGAVSARGIEGERASLDRALRGAFAETSLPALLRYEDRNSMAHSVESRLPFLTPELVEFAFSLPAAALIGGPALSKAVLRDAMRGLVPAPVIERRDKIGFQMPTRLWLQPLAPWIDEVLGSDAAAAIPMLDPDRVRELARAARTGDRELDWGLWRVLNLVRWSERYEIAYE